MARSGSLLPVVAIAIFAAWTFCAPSAFVAPQVASAMVDMPDMVAAAPMVDMDTSLTLAGTVEPLVMGIVMGTVPVTVFGLMVAAWLQFKKGPTLGL